MKKVVLIICLSFLYYCSEKKGVSCQRVFSDVDTSLCFFSNPYNIDGLCVQKMKIKCSTKEYGYSNLVKDSVIIFKDSMGVYFSDNKSNVLMNKKILISNSKTKEKEYFYDQDIKDTIYRTYFDAKIKGISNSNIFLCLLVGKMTGIRGIYIHDKSDYILKNYSKSIIRSVKGNIYPKRLDTTNLVIYNGKPKGIF